MCGNKFLCQWLWHSFAKLCTKNYENPSIFVKVTAKKSVAPFFWTRCSGLNTYGLNGLWKGDEHPAYAPSDYGPPFDHLPLLTDVSCVWPCSLLCFFSIIPLLTQRNETMMSSRKRLAVTTMTKITMKITDVIYSARFTHTATVALCDRPHRDVVCWLVTSELWLNTAS